MVQKLARWATAPNTNASANALQTTVAAMWPASSIVPIIKENADPISRFDPFGHRRR